MKNNLYLSPKEILVLANLVTYHTGQIAKFLEKEENLSPEKIKEIETLMSLYHAVMLKLGEKVE